MNDQSQVYLITDEYMQSYHVKTLSYELIENLIYFLCFYPIAAIINNIFDKNENMLYLNLITIIPVFLMTYFRVKIKTMGKFILSIVLVISISLIIIGLILKQYIFLAILFIWAADCIKRSISTQRVKFDKSKLIFLEALLIPQIIIAACLELESVQIITAIISIVMMLISIGYICKARNVRLAMDDLENKTFNSKDNNIFIAGTILLIGIIIFMLFMLGTFDAAYELTKKIANVLMNLLNGNVVIKPSGDVNNVATKNKDNNDVFKNILQQAGEPNKFTKIILMILNVIFDIIFIVASITIIYLLINRILIYIKKLRNKDNITFDFRSNKENEIKKKVNKIRFYISKSIFKNDKEKIRKLYKDKILKYKKNNIKINNSFSTSEIQKEILRKALDNIGDATKVYEKARYSNEAVTKDDVEILKHTH